MCPQWVALGGVGGAKLPVRAALWMDVRGDFPPRSESNGLCPPPVHPWGVWGNFCRLWLLGKGAGTQIMGAGGGGGGGSSTWSKSLPPPTPPPPSNGDLFRSCPNPRTAVQGFVSLLPTRQSSAGGGNGEGGGRHIFLFFFFPVSPSLQIPWEITSVCSIGASSPPSSLNPY